MMEYRTLGKTGLNVSALGFGGAPIGLQNYLSPEDRDSDAFRATVHAMVREAVARGINYFDTAPGYGKGRSESLLGETLAPYRDRIHLATKYWYAEGMTRVEFIDGVKASLERLHTDHVEVLQFHGGVYTDAQAEHILSCGLLDWVDDLRAQGCCRFTGLTAEGPSGALERLLRSGRFDVLQVAYNLTYQCACDYQREPKGVIPLAKSLGMGVVTMRTPTSGFLQKLLAREFPGIDTGKVTRMAINFVLSTPEVDCALVGMRRAEEVVANADLAADTGSRYDLRELHERYL